MLGLLLLLDSELLLLLLLLLLQSVVADGSAALIARERGSALADLRLHHILVEGFLCDLARRLDRAAIGFALLSRGGGSLCCHADTLRGFRFERTDAAVVDAETTGCVRAVVFFNSWHHATAKL